jgi:Holliday junction resolvase RusA-like endonuclease
MLKFTIPLDPKTKKNSMEPRLDRNGKVLGLKQSDAYEQYESDCLKLIPAKVRLHISEPVNVKATYYMKTRRRVDKTNLESALLDILVKAGVLTDDSALNPKIVVGTDGSRVRYDKDNPRTEVVIEAIEDSSKI